MTTSRAILKAINRHIRKARFFDGGRQYGVDWPTWSICHPQLARTFRHHAELIAGRTGLFMPAALNQPYR